MQKFRIYLAALIVSTITVGIAAMATESSGQYRFNSEGTPTPSTPENKRIEFKVPAPDSDKTQANPVENISNDQPFKTYIGYPKHTLQLDLMPLNASEKWNYNGQPFNFSSTTSGIDLLYRMTITPQMNVELNYNQYSVKTDASTIGLFGITASSTTVRNYSAAYNYFWISDSNFFHRWGVGLDVGYADYPILGFDTGVNLSMKNAKDTTVGAHLNYQYPVLPNFLFISKLGYIIGTGLGNSGYLTTKSDTILFFNAGLDWSIDQHSGVNAAFFYSSQNAKTSGPIPAGTDTWTTTSNILGGKIGYSYTF